MHPLEGFVCVLYFWGNDMSVCCISFAQYPISLRHYCSLLLVPFCLNFAPKSTQGKLKLLIGTTVALSLSLSLYRFTLHTMQNCKTLLERSGKGFGYRRNRWGNGGRPGGDSFILLKVILKVCVTLEVKVCLAQR